METENETKKLILDAKNICLIPSENEPESLTAALALFYTLRELGKNVNLVADGFPEPLGFLVPSIDFLQIPKHFVISIPQSTAEISQVYYEKTDENVKIHLIAEKGNLKKEHVSFYFQETKPDLVITLGVRDFRKYLELKLDSFGFLLGATVVNIDNHEDNLTFGQVNLVEQKSLAEIILALLDAIDSSLVKKDCATCLMLGLVMYYQNFKSDKTTAETFITSAKLIERGADYKSVTHHFSSEEHRQVAIEKIVLA